MISKKEFKDIMSVDRSSCSRDNLYICYLYLENIPIIINNFKLNKYIVWNKKNILNKYKNDVSEYLIENKVFCDFWDQVIKENKIIQLKELSQFYKNKGKSSKDYFSLNNYIQLILNHMIPKTNDIIFKINYKEKEKRDIYQKIQNINNKSTGGIYGIYEDNELVYIGMTSRSFQCRWNEHLEKIKIQSKELALYNLIDVNKQITFKVLLDRTEMEKISDDKITKRDIQAMEFALIQEHKPKYNLAGNTTPYIF